MKTMNVSLHTNKITSPKSYNTVFKTNTNTNYQDKTKYQKTLEKRAYIDEKTEGLEEVSALALLLSLFLDTHHIDFKSKLKTKEIIGICSLGICIATFLAKAIKASKLSKEYDKENDK